MDRFPYRAERRPSSKVLLIISIDTCHYTHTRTYTHRAQRHTHRVRNKIQLKALRDSDNSFIIKSGYQRFFHKSNYKYIHTDPRLQFGLTPGSNVF